MHAYRPEVYTPALLPTWLAIAARQAPKDRILIPRIARLLGPGVVLELGSGPGHIARLLEATGRQVIASDYAEFFVEHMNEQGLRAMRIDATDISAAELGPLPNIFCQSITPFITDDEGVIRQAYRSAFQALQPGGRLVLVHAMAMRPALRDVMRKHARLSSEAGFSLIEIRRDQLLPTAAYRIAPALARGLEAAFGSRWGSRFVLSASKPQGTPVPAADLGV